MQWELVSTYFGLYWVMRPNYSMLKIKNVHFNEMLEIIQNTANILGAEIVCTGL